MSKSHMLHMSRKSLILASVSISWEDARERCLFCFFSMFFWNVTAVPGVFFLVACLH